MTAAQIKAVDKHKKLENAHASLIPCNLQMSEEEDYLILRMLADLDETHQRLGATVNLLSTRGEALQSLAEKSSNLEAFSHSFKENVERKILSCPCFGIGVLCFIFSVALGVIIVAFLCSA